MQGDAVACTFTESSSAPRYAKVLGLLPARAASELPQLLAVSANPDQALLQLEVLLQQHPDPAVTAFGSSSLALSAAVALFGSSQWLGQTLLKNPDLLHLFARPSGLVQARWAEDFREQFARFRLRSHDVALPVLLARFKRREYVRIFARELLGLATLSEITGEISALSDVLIERALIHCESELRRKYQGWPQLRFSGGRVYAAGFSVLALGKLGGSELNYSSDIDLLYIYDDAEDAGAISIPAREFFTRLAQELTSVLSTISEDGQVFRVDLRLRPQGASGEMVAGVSQALRYYRNVAQDWELQALLKLRANAGDLTLGREFASQVQALIYSESLNLSAIQTAARSLERIQRGVVRRGAGGLDVKSGRGGLRELEFVAQCLQRVHGGGEPWLRASATLFALQKLHDKGHIGDAEFRELGVAYRLLRTIEHRLQCRQGAQVHRLPESISEQRALLRSLPQPAPASAEELEQIMKSASDLCVQVLSLGTREAAGEPAPLSLNLGVSGAERLKRELAALSPALAHVLAADVGDITLRNLQRFLSAASTGEQRIRSAIENVEWIERALPVFARSAVATTILSGHPEDVVALFRPCQSESADSVSDHLRIESRRCLLRLLGQTLLERKPVWEVLREYSHSFDRIVQEALAASNAPEGFTVFAVGRLGTCELDVVSDADLVFVRSPECNAEAAGRCVQALVSMLSGYTREGSVIVVDTRLRPHGGQGELVVSARQLAQYFENEAKAWEVLAFGKMRLVAGNHRLFLDVSQGLRALRRRYSVLPAFVPELRAMRKRIADSTGAESFKTGPGGLYDLDFLLGMLESRADLQTAGKQFPERLQALSEAALLSPPQAAELSRAGELFRRTDHAIRVVEGRSRKWLPESDTRRAIVEGLVNVPALEEKLRGQMRSVRAIFELFFEH